MESKEHSDEDRDEGNNETADEKRLRLAREYLARLGAVEEDDRPTDDLISYQLGQDALKLRGKRFQAVASQLEGKEFAPVKSIKGHQVCIDYNMYAVTGSKDGTIVKWDLQTLKKLYTLHSQPKKPKRPHASPSIPTSTAPTTTKSTEKNTTQNKEQHSGGILAVAISSSGQYLATGGEDRAIIIRDLTNGNFVNKFLGHRGGITGLCFVDGVNNLYSCSLDGTVKVWSLSEMTYIDTLFGHQSEALTIALLSSAKERCVTAGRDRSVRVWKVAEEKQLLFKAGAGNIDSVAALGDDVFVTAADTGLINVWNINKKRPTCSIQSHESGVLPWVSAVGGIFQTDLCASGGSDGWIRLWKVEGPRIAQVAKIPLEGCVNGICFAGNKLVVAIGQEHRLGRWSRVPKVRNGIAVVPLPLTLLD